MGYRKMTTDEQMKWLGMSGEHSLNRFKEFCLNHPENVPLFIKDDPTTPLYDDFISYHNSWDWLMLVVEKINKRDWVTIYCDECKIHALNSGEFEDIVVIKEGGKLIETVYEAVVKYIELGLKF